MPYAQQIWKSGSVVLDTTDLAHGTERVAKDLIRVLSLPLQPIMLFYPSSNVPCARVFPSRLLHSRTTSNNLESSSRGIRLTAAYWARGTVVGAVGAFLS